MAYRCQLCTARLDAGATICGQCRANLDRAVPSDAETSSADIYIKATRPNKLPKTGVLLLLALVGVVAFCVFCIHLGNSYGNPNATPSDAATVMATPGASSSADDLSADIQYIGNQFYVSNKNGYDWKNVELTVLAKQWEYTEKVPQIKSNTVLVTDMRRFICADTGERFNPQWIENPSLRAKVIHSGSVGRIEFKIAANTAAGQAKDWELAGTGQEVTPLVK